MKRMIGMMLVVVVGCGTETQSPKTTVESGYTQEESVGSDLTEQFVDPNLTTPVESQTTEPSMDSFLDMEPDDSFDDMEPDLVRNENGEVIEFTGFSETDADLKQLRDMPELKTLHLLGSENITDAGLVHLKGLTNLQDLYLGGTQITDAGLVHLKELTNLQDLDLSLCEKITDAGLAHLKGMTNLETLGLIRTQITDAGLVHLKGMTNLQSLDLMETQITDAGLAQLEPLALDYLDVPDSAKTDIGLKHYIEALDPDTIGGYLSLAGWNLTDDGLVHLKDQTNLESLDLMETQITDAGLIHLKGLTNLQDLYLGGTLITDAGLIHLKELTKLQFLNLDGCEKITDTGVAELQKALPNCEMNR